MDGACVDGLIYDYLLWRAPASVAGLRVAERSAPFGMPPLVVPARLDPRLRRQLADVLFHMHEEEGGRRLLDSLLIDRFIPAADTLYRSVRGLRLHRLQP